MYYLLLGYTCNYDLFLWLQKQSFGCWDIHANEHQFADN